VTVEVEQVVELALRVRQPGKRSGDDGLSCARGALVQVGHFADGTEFVE